MIKTVETKEEVKTLFNFFEDVFKLDAKEYNEKYFDMSDRYNEMLDQFDKDKDLIMYIEENNNIVAGICGKNMKDGKITLSILAVSKEYRNKGYAKKLILEFEKRCKNKGITHIDLGARIRAAALYKKLGYSYSLMIQVFDFVTIEDVRKANTYNLEEGYSYQGDTYGFIFFKVDDIKEDYINHFEKNVKTAHAQYIFEKDL